MPYDVNGNRADIIMDPTSIISRANLGRLYEIYFNGASRVARDMVRDVLRKNPDDIDRAWDIVLEFLSILETEQYYGYKEATHEEKLAVLDEIMRKEFFLLYTISADKPAYEIVLELKNSKFAPVKEEIYIPESGKVYKTFEKMSIGSLYTILLGKTPDDGLSSVSDTFLNHYGFPAKISPSARNNLSWKAAAIKFFSETDIRLIAACCGAYGLIILKDRANSIETNKNIHKNILLADKPGAIKCAVDRNEAPLGNDSAIKLLKAIFNAMGIDFVYKEDKGSNRVRESDPRIGYKKGV